MWESLEEGLHTYMFLPLHSAYGKERSSYAVSKLAEYRQENWGTQYTVPWFGYTLNEGTWELVEHNLQHSVKQLLRRKQRTQK